MSVSLFFSKALGMTEVMIELPDILLRGKKKKKLVKTEKNFIDCIDSQQQW